LQNLNLEAQPESLESILNSFLQPLFHINSWGSENDITPAVLASLAWDSTRIFGFVDLFNRASKFRPYDAIKHHVHSMASVNARNDRLSRLFFHVLWLHWKFRWSRPDSTGSLSCSRKRSSSGALKDVKGKRPEYAADDSEGGSDDGGEGVDFDFDGMEGPMKNHFVTVTIDFKNLFGSSRKALSHILKGKAFVILGRPNGTWQFITLNCLWSYSDASFESLVKTSWPLTAQALFPDQSKSQLLLRLQTGDWFKSSNSKKRGLGKVATSLEKLKEVCLFVFIFPLVLILIYFLFKRV
jgi:hypothetical protein